MCSSDLKNVNTSSPIQVASGVSFSQVAAGYQYSLAIQSVSGILYAWGLNNNRQLGLNSTGSYLYPIPSGGPFLNDFSQASWSKIAAGRYVSLALNNGVPYLFGTGFVTNVASSPVRVNSSQWSKISSNGGTSLLLISKTGALYGWGDNTYGQIGPNNKAISTLGVSYYPLIYPFETYGGVGIYYSWSQVAVGVDHVLTLRSDGALFGWGNNNVGQLATGNTLSFGSMISLGTSWSQIAAGSSFSLGITTTGALFGWGLNTSGQLGIGTITSVSSPVQIGTSSWSQVSAGQYHTSSIRSDGALFTWGLNSSAQLGTGDTVTYSSPIQIGTSSWLQVSAGEIGRAHV